jgi:hypothetical protein
VNLLNNVESGERGTQFLCQHFLHIQPFASNLQMVVVFHFYYVKLLPHFLSSFNPLFYFKLTCSGIGVATSCAAPDSFIKFSVNPLINSTNLLCFEDKPEVSFMNNLGFYLNLTDIHQQCQWC